MVEAVFESEFVLQNQYQNHNRLIYWNYFLIRRNFEKIRVILLTVLQTKKASWNAFCTKKKKRYKNKIKEITTKRR